MIKIAAAAGRIVLHIMMPLVVYGVLCFAGGLLSELIHIILLLANPGDGTLLALYEDNEGVLGMAVNSLMAFVVLGRMYASDCRRFVWKAEAKGTAAQFLAIAASVAFFAIGFNVILNQFSDTAFYQGYNETMEDVIETNPLLMLFYSVVIAALAEELLMRALIFRRARESMSFLPAAVLSSALFGLIHGNLVQFLYAALFGFALAYLYECFATMKASVFAHMTANAVSLLADGVIVFLSRSFIPAFSVAIGSALTAAAVLVLFRIGKSAAPSVRSRLAPAAVGRILETKDMTEAESE